MAAADFSEKIPENAGEGLTFSDIIIVVAAHQGLQEKGGGAFDEPKPQGLLLLLAAALLVATMAMMTAGPALAAPGGNQKGSGLGVGGGDTSNQKDVKAEKTRTGGGPLNNPSRGLTALALFNKEGRNAIT